MKSKVRFRAVITFVLAVTLLIVWSASRQTQATAATAKISELAWLAGDWQTSPGGRDQVEEHWTLPAGGTMLSMGRTIRGDKTVEFEFLRIEQRGDDIFYVAHPNAKCPQTDFKLTRLAANEVVFENPKHDFPERVIYQKNSDGSLVASVDAGEGTKSQTFSYVPIRK